MNRSMVLLSGGVDSAVTLAAELERGREVVTLAVDYGQRHGRELGNAQAIAAHYKVPHAEFDMSGWGKLVTSALTTTEITVPYGHYAAPEQRSTVVPNRNAVLLMAAAGIGVSQGCDLVIIAAHQGDAAIYPDCRLDFLMAISKAVGLATDGEIAVEAPFLLCDKAGIVRVGGRLGVPFNLTWSCYEGGNIHCGNCGACVERMEAFELAEVADPTVYAVHA